MKTISIIACLTVATPAHALSVIQEPISLQQNEIAPTKSTYGFVRIASCAVYYYEMNRYFVSQGDYKMSTGTKVSYEVMVDIGKEYIDQTGRTAEEFKAVVSAIAYEFNHTGKPLDSHNIGMLQNKLSETCESIKENPITTIDTLYQKEYHGLLK